MSFSFKYKSVVLPSGAKINRPMIPLTIGNFRKIDVIGMLDSGSDITLIPKEIADEIGVEYCGENKLSGISGNIINVMQSKILVSFGRGREIYDFQIPILVPVEKEDVPIIIGRLGFFNQFKIIFSEAEKRIEFKKFDMNKLII